MNQNYKKIVVMIPILGIPILGILIAETLISNKLSLYGLGTYIVSVFIILFFIFSFESRIRNLLQSLILLILIRVTYLSTPQIFIAYLQYALIFGIMIIPIYLAVRCQQVGPKFDERYIYIPVSVIVGFLLNIQNGRLNDIETYIGGELLTIFLVICLSISLLLPDKYLDRKYVSESLDICYAPVLLTFVTILIFRMISVV